MPSVGFFRHVVANALTAKTSDLDVLQTRINAGVSALLRYVLPACAGPISPSALNFQLFATFLDNRKFGLSCATEAGLPEVLAFAFLLGEKSCGQGSFFFEVDDRSVKRVRYQPTATLSEIVIALRELKAGKTIEHTLTKTRYTQKNALYFPELIDGDIDGWLKIEGTWPVSAKFFLYSSSVRENEFKTLRADPAFVDRVYRVFLKIILMPLSLLQAIFLDAMKKKAIPTLEEEQEAIFIAEMVMVQNKDFFFALLKTESFLKWYFSNPEKIMKGCLPQISEHVNQETFEYMRDRVTFLLSVTRIRYAFESFLPIKTLLARQKSTHQKIPRGPDFYAIVAALNRVYEDMHCLEESHFFQMDWAESRLYLYERIDFILQLFNHILIENTGRQLDDFLRELRSVMAGLFDITPPLYQKTQSDSYEWSWMEMFVGWLEQKDSEGNLENKAVIIAIAERVYARYFSAKKKVSAEVLSVAASGYFYVSQFFLAPAVDPMPASQSAFSRDDLSEFSRLIGEADCFKQLGKAFVCLFVRQGEKIDEFHEALVHELFLEFQRQYIAYEVIRREDLPQAIKVFNVSNDTLWCTAESLEYIPKTFIHKIRNVVQEEKRRGFTLEDSDDDVVVVSVNDFLAPMSMVPR